MTEEIYTEYIIIKRKLVISVIFYHDVIVGPDSFENFYNFYIKSPGAKKKKKNSKCQFHIRKSLAGKTGQRRVTRQDDRKPVKIHSFQVFTTSMIKWAQSQWNWTELETGKHVALSDKSGFLLRYTDGRIKIWCQQNESIDPACLVSTMQAAVILWWYYFLAHLPHSLLLLTMCIMSWTQFTHLLMAASSMIMYHVTKQMPSHLVSWKWHEYSFLLPSRQLNINIKEHLWNAVEWETAG